MARGGAATLSFSNVPRPATITVTVTYQGNVTQSLGSKMATWDGTCGCYVANFSWTVPTNAGVGAASVSWHMVYQTTVFDSSWPFTVT